MERVTPEPDRVAFILKTIMINSADAASQRNADAAEPFAPKAREIQIEMQIHWRSGIVTTLTVKRSAPGEGSLKTPEPAVALIKELASRYIYDEIAKELNARGLRSAFERPFTKYHVGYVCRREGIGRGKPQDEH